MAEPKTNPLAGFDLFADVLVGNRGGIKDLGDSGGTAGDGFQDIDPDDLQKQLSDPEPTKPVTKPDKEPKKPDTKVPDTEPVVDPDNEPEPPADPDPDDKSDEDKEYESEISTFFGSELAKKLKLEIDEKDLKFDSIDEVLELMSEVVQENSKPTYASEEVEAYDEFVRNGGNLKDFYRDVFSSKLDLEAVDIEKDYDQRAIIRENLLNQGYKEEKIKKMISRYEEAETLKEEAEDAMDLLKEYNQKRADSLLEQQKNEALNRQKQQQKFFEDVNSTIKTISNFRGFPISEKEKRELLQYAFVPDDDGLTRHQKDLRTDVYNILESAYFAKNRDKIKAGDVNKTSGSTDAYKTLRDRLKAKGNKQQVDDNQKGGRLGGSSLGDFGRGIIF